MNICMWTCIIYIGLMYIRKYVIMPVTLIYMHKYCHVHTYMHIYIHIRALHAHVRTHTYIDTYMHTHTSTRAYMHIYIHIYIHTYTSGPHELPAEPFKPYIRHKSDHTWSESEFMHEPTSPPRIKKRARDAGWRTYPRYFAAGCSKTWCTHDSWIFVWFFEARMKVYIFWVHVFMNVHVREWWSDCVCICVCIYIYYDMQTFSKIIIFEWFLKQEWRCRYLKQERRCT